MSLKRFPRPLAIMGSLAILACLFFASGCRDRRPQLPVGAYPLTCCGDAWGMNPADMKRFAKKLGFDDHPEWLQGVTLTHNDRIFIKVLVRDHLSASEKAVLVHEQAHRDDNRIGVSGASMLWRVLCGMPGGLYHMTHRKINEIVLPELGIPLSAGNPTED